MARITGIGGIFLKINYDVKKLLSWYQEILGLDVSEYGINFLTPNNLTLITFEENDGNTLLNFSVDNLEEFMTQLKEKGVVIHQEIQNYEFGRFAQIKDPFDQIVELSELNNDQYIKMVEKEIEDYKKTS